VATESQDQRIGRNAAVSAAAELLGKLATFALIVVVARALGVADFGAFSFALSLSLLLMPLAQWGFDSEVERAGSAHPDRLPLLLVQVLAWRTSIAVPLFVVAAAVATLTQPTARAAVVIVLVFLASLVDSYGEVGRSVATARQQQAGVAGAQVVQRFTAALMGIGAVVAGLGLVGLAAGYLVGSVVGGLAVLRAVRRLGVAWTPRELTRAGMSELARKAHALAIASVFWMLLYRFDAVFLGAVKGDHALGAYAAAYRLLETVFFVAWSVRRAVFPVMSAAVDTERLRAEFERAIALVAWFYLPFGTLLLIEAPTVLRVAFGPAYAVESAASLRWLALAPLCFGVLHLAAFALLARERRSDVVWASIIAAGANVAANLVLIPRFAGAGAAAANTGAFLLAAVVLVAFLHNDVGTLRVWHGLAAPVVASALMAAVLLGLGPSTGFALRVLAATAAYLGCWYALLRLFATDDLRAIRALAPRRRSSAPEEE
jgi:O-antigen/teichoic acid export membrane protein